jgi:hypothetical protein
LELALGGAMTATGQVISNFLAGLGQRAWRDFGANRLTTTPEPANHLEGQPA